LLDGNWWLTVEEQGGGNGTVGDIVVPPVVVGEVGQIASQRDGLADSPTAKYQKSTKRVGPELAQVNIFPEEGPVTFGALFLSSRDCDGVRFAITDFSDDERATVGHVEISGT